MEETLARLSSLGGALWGHAKARETQVDTSGGTYDPIPGLFAWFTETVTTDDSLDAILSVLESLRELKGVRFTGTRVTEHGVKRIWEKRPDLWVEYLGERGKTTFMVRDPRAEQDGD